MLNDSSVNRAIRIGLNEIQAQLDLIKKDKKKVYETLDEMMLAEK